MGSERHVQDEPVYLVDDRLSADQVRRPPHVQEFFVAMEGQAAFVRLCDLTVYQGDPDERGQEGSGFIGSGRLR